MWDIQPGDDRILSTDLDDLIYNWDGDEDELEALKEFRGAWEDYAPDYAYGGEAIHEDAFTEYAQDLVGDLGFIEGVPDFISNAIDWEAVAEALAQDYTIIEWDGEEYYVR